MARIEVLTLDGEVASVRKEPAQYFAEWRAEIDRARRRREALGLDPFQADRRRLAAWRARSARRSAEAERADEAIPA